MCCFSAEVKHVFGTQIFARPSRGDAQILVYNMNILAEQDVAMILPLPVPPRSAENAVRFINLEAYPEFFTALNGLFPEWVAMGAVGAPVTARAPLAVHNVGQFEASFIPSIDDFSRLDPRFRLPATTWQELPQYGDWGFAVFKLRQPTISTPLIPAATGFFKRLFDQAGMQAPSVAPVPNRPQRFHPMAFEFPRRNPAELFFPTVHIHDQRVHPVASFDHQLYFQLKQPPVGIRFPGTDSREIRNQWVPLAVHYRNKLRVAEAPIEQHLNLRRAAGTLLPSVPLYRWELRGELPNQDSILEI